MKSKIAIAVCLICFAGICGVGIAGDGDGTLGAEDGFLYTDSSGLDRETVAAIPARVEKTGQTTSYGSRDDGSLQRGVTWPKPRFTDNGNGTARDNLTGLIWLKNANCSVFYEGDITGHNHRSWNAALRAANALKDGYCGLTDGSVAKNWRLPNRKELESLLHLGYCDPAIPNTAGTGKWSEGDPFLAVQMPYYWSSTTYPNSTGTAWYVDLTYGLVGPVVKQFKYCVWPVRGPQ